MAAIKKTQTVRKTRAIKVTEGNHPTDLTPKQAEIKAKKNEFLVILSKNDGNVSSALLGAKLTRKVAYLHFKTDNAFASAWLEALEVSNDGLFTEARRRAHDGVLEPVFHNGKKVASVKKYSDTLLIFLLKQSEAQKKWRNRIIQAGTIALETVRTAGIDAKLSEEQIIQIQNQMADRLNEVSLV